MASNYEKGLYQEFEKLADEIISLDEDMQKLKDKDFAKKTEEFKERLQNLLHIKIIFISPSFHKKMLTYLTMSTF